ncbi:penicillin-binding transpeptidase domain-containing protein [Actinomadura fibrosa]|uniref:Penicillin-binding transpeptidase domain-containing protein n=1 Tax=Actinomadura fibrosa TaxID=111802 RepID=A0ABW2XLE9_9ACTN|nr:penicillin-binding transpeptidase domain-containing protein [Actinomadura fibrosa]
MTNLPMTRRGRRRAPAGSRTLRRRAISMAACGGLVASLTTGCWAEPSAMPAVRDFLIAWQVGNYPAAAKKTIGTDHEKVSDALGEVRAQLDAASLRLALGVPGQDTSTKAIEKKGDEADASFSVKVDLGENGQPWTYKGSMHLRRVGGKWKVVWAPSIINPQLKEGQRLAVVSETPPRATIKDVQGHTLLHKVPAWDFGVYPGQLKNPQRTLTALAKETTIDGGRKLDPERLLGRVRSAPPQRFLPLLTLRKGQDNAEAYRLARIPGIGFRNVQVPIAPTAAPELVGSLGPATADRLQQVGAPYQPGDTIGVSGIQLIQQRRLAGTPTVSVVAQDASGANTEKLRTWEGQQPQEVSTTLNPRQQTKADNALAGLTVPASLVAVRPSDGQVVAVANHGTLGRNLAFEGRYPPGTAFGILSAETLFSSAGMTHSTKTECPGTVTVGGQTFTSKGRPAGSFASSFAGGCATTLAQLSGKVDTRTLMAEAGRLGIGKSWGMGVPAFTGSLPTPANDGEKAAAMAGQGKVQMSPLGMALLAAAAQSGTWRPPYVLSGLTNPAETPQAQTLQPAAINGLKGLLSRAIKTGAARAAYVYGDAVGTTASPTWTEGGQTRTVSWFVGSRGDLAFAIAIEGHASAADVAAKFLRGTPAKTTGTTAGAAAR